MTKRYRILPLLLSGILLLSACNRSNPSQADATASESTAAGTTSIVETTETAEITETSQITGTTSDITVTPTPVREEKILPEPYIDIEFFSDGTMRDIREHVSCTLPNATNGRVENTAVTFASKVYTVPHLHVEKEQGAVLLTYEYLVSEADVTQLMSGGFTVEAFLVNHNRLAAGSTEQCMTNAGQSGGFGLSIKNGKLGFGAYAGTTYKTASFPGKYSTDSLTHVIGVYDPDAKQVRLYLNGNLVDTVEAEGAFRPAQQNTHPYIVLGGDIGIGGKTELHATNTRIVDFKLYPTALSADHASTAYQTATAQLMGTEPSFDLIYQPVEGLPEGTKNAAYKNVFESFADVYEPLTALTVSPTVWQWADENLSAMANAEQRPATVVFDLKLSGGVLHAIDPSGRDLGTAEDAVKALGGKIIPAFRVSDSATAAPLTELINRHNLGDCFVICADGALMKEICDATTCARPVLDRSSVTEV